MHLLGARRTAPVLRRTRHASVLRICAPLRCCGRPIQPHEGRSSAEDLRLSPELEEEPTALRADADAAAAPTTTTTAATLAARVKLAALAVAALLLAVPYARPEASWLAGVTGAVVGLLLGFGMYRLEPSEG